MRPMLTIVGVIAFLIAFDAMAFEGKYRQAAWRGAQTQARSFNDTLNRMMRFASAGR